MLLCEPVIIILSICQKLGSVGSVQQKIKLHLPFHSKNKTSDISLLVIFQPGVKLATYWSLLEKES